MTTELAGTISLTELVIFSLYNRELIKEIHVFEDYRTPAKQAGVSFGVFLNNMIKQTLERLDLSPTKIDIIR